MRGPVLIAAVEPSGDALGGALMRAMREIEPGLSFVGCGGEEMADAGLASLFPIAPLAVMGFTDVARAAPAGYRGAGRLAAAVREYGVSAAVFVDGWAFSRIGARALRRRARHVRIYKYAAPQVWASRPQRVDFVRDHFDGVLALLPFEPPIFEAAGVKAAFVGNPTYQKAASARGDGAAFRARRAMGDAPVLLIAPGSRRGEIDRLVPVFREVAGAAGAEFPTLRVAAVLAPAVREAAAAALADWPLRVDFVEPGEKYDAFAAADVALAASGTVSTELAIHGAAHVVAYRVDALTAVWARRVMTTPFVSIVNVLADDFAVPEFVQEECRPDLIANAVRRLIRDPLARNLQRAASARAVERLDLSGPPAAVRAAQRLEDWEAMAARGAPARAL